MKILREGFSLDEFFSQLAESPQSLLLLDYDGTLSPFVVERNEAVPYAGVRERIEAILDSAPPGDDEQPGVAQRTHDACERLEVDEGVQVPPKAIPVQAPRVAGEGLNQAELEVSHEGPLVWWLPHPRR